MTARRWTRQRVLLLLWGVMGVRDAWILYTPRFEVALGSGGKGAAGCPNRRQRERERGRDSEWEEGEKALGAYRLSFASGPPSLLLVVVSVRPDTPRVLGALSITLSRFSFLQPPLFLFAYLRNRASFACYLSPSSIPLPPHPPHRLTPALTSAGL
jgi:hypothetical protein